MRTPEAAKESSRHDSQQRARNDVVENPSPLLATGDQSDHDAEPQQERSQSNRPLIDGVTIHSRQKYVWPKVLPENPNSLDGSGLMQVA